MSIEACGGTFYSLLNAQGFALLPLPSTLSPCSSRFPIVTATCAETTMPIPNVSLHLIPFVEIVAGVMLLPALLVFGWRGMKRRRREGLDARSTDRRV